jgi:hypothetical protein
VRVDAGSAGQRTIQPRLQEGGIMMSDAWSNGNDMSTGSEERRRAEAALVRAVDGNPDVAAEGTRAAVCEYVDLLADEGLLPETVVIAFKTALARAESLHRLEPESREETRSALVSACIQRYFRRNLADDVRITRSPALRLVRDEREARRGAQAPDASA